MAGWLNWREIEKNNDWGVRGKNDATAQLWDNDAPQWEKRSQREENFTRQQVALLKLSEEDWVLDVCCGTGPPTVPIAPKVKQVTAFDYSSSMLEYVKQKLEKLELTNCSVAIGIPWSPELTFPNMILP
jgi:ubiquinone/menaquinone biosynthesis C-methylase UbiE